MQRYNYLQNAILTCKTMVSLCRLLSSLNQSSLSVPVAMWLLGWLAKGWGCAFAIITQVCTSMWISLSTLKWSNLGSRFLANGEGLGNCVHWAAAVAPVGASKKRHTPYATLTHTVPNQDLITNPGPILDYRMLAIMTLTHLHNWHTQDWVVRQLPVAFTSFQLCGTPVHSIGMSSVVISSTC